MPIVAEPLEKLQSCHGRIEEQLQSLERLTQQVAAGAPEAAAASAARAVLHYFDSSGAQHHRDEDEHLFPLLRARAAALGRTEVAAAVDELEREHATLEALWLRLREPLGRLAALHEARIDADDAARFAWLHRRHMDREELLVLPFARETLVAAERAELGARMAAVRTAK